MNDKITVEQLLVKCEEVSRFIWEQNINRYQEIKKLVGQVGIALEKFIFIVQQYQLEDVSVELVVKQLNSIVTGLEEENDILIADILNYEIYNTLLLYLEVLNVLEEEKR